MRGTAEMPGRRALPRAAADAAHGLTRASLEGSYAPVCAKLRAATSEIVDCAAEFCHELEAAPLLRGAQGKRATEPPADPGTEAATTTFCADSERGGGSVVAGGEARELGNERPPHDASVEHAEASEAVSFSDLCGQEGRRRCVNGLVENVSSGARVEGGAQMQLEVAQVDDAMQLHTSECQGEEARGCKSCSQGRLTSDEYCATFEDRGEHCATLELPPVPLDNFHLEFSTLKTRGEALLHQTVALYDKDARDWNANVPDAWSCKEICLDVLPRQLSCDAVQEPQSQEKLILSCQPRRMQFDWCEIIKTGEAFLYEDSGRLLKAMVRANAQVMLFVKDTDVSNVFDGDWGLSLHGMFPPRSMEGGGGDVQNLLFPFELVRDDDEKIANAPSNLITIAGKYFHDLQRSDVSLTKASLNIPSLWNLSVATSRLEGLVTEELSTMPMEPNLPTTFSCTPIAAQLDTMASEMTDQKMLLSTTKNGELDSSARQANHQSPGRENLAVTAEDDFLSTDYFLSDTFLGCNWSRPPTEKTIADTAARENTGDSQTPLESHQLIQQIARPALWDLMRKEMLPVGGTSLTSALNCVSLETLEAIIYQQCRVVKKMSMNPSAFSSLDISEACASLRQASWLHTLRIVSISNLSATDGKAILARILTSSKYKLVLGPSNWKDLLAFLKVLGGSALPEESIVSNDLDSGVEVDLAAQPPRKKQRVLNPQNEAPPVRVLCSFRFLEQVDLLDDLCTEQQIFFIERDLPTPIDILVDERNCICVVAGATIQAEANLRAFVFSLARLQVEVQKCWLIIVLDISPSADMEDAISLFYAALVQFRVTIQVFTCFSCEETSCYIRAIVDQCAEAALNCHRILPRLWFERPFLLEEESQFERFLVSTKVVNHYAAQSLLHKICMEDLFLKGFDELKLLVQNAITEEQLQLLWGFMQQHHGLN